MFNNSIKTTLIFILLAGLFAAGLIRLFQIRFEAGDLYPAYSSLRADPLGSRALFESIKELSDGQLVSRNFKPVDQIQMAADKTVFILGLSGYDQKLFGRRWENLFNHLEEEGGRLVISFPSIRLKQKQKPANNDKDKVTEDGPADTGEAPDDCENSDKCEDNPAEEALSEDEDNADEDLWAGISELGIRFIYQNTGKTSEVQAALKNADMPDFFPETIFWPLTGHFKIEDPIWNILYTRNDEPVMATRTWGRGTLVMLSDSYLFSNEGLQKNRSPILLAWLFEKSGTLVFDEFHHGLLASVGTVDLIKKYRLQGMVLSLFILVGLLIWRQMALMPVVTDLPEKQAFFLSDEGAAPAHGWVALVERHIPPKELLNVCYNAWCSSEAINRVSKDRQDAAQDIMTAHASEYHKHKNASTYEKLYKLIKQGKMS